MLKISDARFTMSKKAVIFLTLTLFIFSLLAAQTNECDETYIKAMTAQSPAQRAQLLKDFLAKCAGKGSQYENFAYANLSLVEYPGKTPKDAIDYGEKALAVGGLDNVTKCQVLVQLSALYSQAGQNLEKAKSYASQVVEIAKGAKAKEPAAESAAQWNQFIGAGYYTLGQAQAKAKDYKGAVDSYLSSYNLLKNPKIMAGIKKLGKMLYDAKDYAGAEKAFKAAYTVTKDYDSTLLYAMSLYRNNRNGESLGYFKEAYAKQKSGEVAYDIGIILAKEAKTNPALAPEAIRYLLEASCTYPAQSQQAMKLAENLFFLSNKDLKYNETVTQIQEKDKKIEELTNAYNTKFGGKEEEDLSDAEKQEMKTLLANIETEKKALEKLQAEQTMAIAKFNKLLEDTKLRLGIK
jgi:tetratricopeptide (TPR) repeat protein